MHKFGVAIWKRHATANYQIDFFEILKTRISVFSGFPEFLRIFEVSGKIFVFVNDPNFL